MADAAVKAAPRVESAKAEIEEEFSRVQDEVRTACESADAKAEELARHKEAETRPPGGGNGERGAVEGLSVDGVVEQISRLELDISRSLSGISERLVEEVNRLAALRSAVLLERQELGRLRDVAARDQPEELPVVRTIGNWNFLEPVNAHQVARRIERRIGQNQRRVALA